MTTPVTKLSWEPLGAVGLPSETMETTAVDVSAAAIAARQIQDAERAQFWAQVHRVAHQARTFYDTIPATVDRNLPTVIKIPLAPALIMAGECHGLSRLALDTITGIPETMAAAFAGQISLSAIPSAAKEMLAMEWDRITEIPTHIMHGALMSAGSNTGYVGGEVIMLVSGVGSVIEVGAGLGRLGVMTTRIIAQSGRAVVRLGEAALITSQDLLVSGANYLKSLSAALEELGAGLMPEMAAAGIPNSYAMVASRHSHLLGDIMAGRRPRLSRHRPQVADPKPTKFSQEPVPKDLGGGIVDRLFLSRFVAQQFAVDIGKVEHALHQLGAPVRLPGQFQYIPTGGSFKQWPRDARGYTVYGPKNNLRIGYVPPGGVGLNGEVISAGRVFVMEVPKKL